MFLSFKDILDTSSGSMAKMTGVIDFQHGVSY